MLARVRTERPMSSIPFALVISLIAFLESAGAQGISRVPDASASRPDSAAPADFAYDPQHAALGWMASGTELLVAHREEYSAHDVRYSGCTETGIYVVPIEGGESRVLTRNAAVCLALQSDRGGAALHPARDRIAYVPLNLSGLLVLDLPGGAVERLPTPCDSSWAVLEAGAWSPQGDRIVTVLGCHHPEAYGALFLISADGRARRRVAGATRWGEIEPTWAPDGRRLAFVQVSDMSGRDTDVIAIMDTLGRERRVLTKGWAPTWSPDGEWIAFFREERVGDDGRVNTIRVIRPDGREEHEVFRSSEKATMSRGWGAFLEGQPWGPLIWSPDSRWLVFGRTFNTATTIWRLRVADGHLDQVTARREPAQSGSR